MSNYTTGLSFLLLLTLGACATVEGEFPSLERRPYETDAPITASNDVAPAPVTLSPELAAKVNALLARHTAAQQSFQRGLGAVQDIARTGSSPGSENWVNAHVQLSRLDKSRADSVEVLRDFDALVTAEGSSDSAIAALLADAQKPVATAVEAQNAEISRLSRLIGE